MLLNLQILIHIAGMVGIVDNQFARNYNNF